MTGDRLMATKYPKRPLPMAADLYGDLYSAVEAAPKSDWRGYFPGLAIVAMGTLAAGFLSDHYGVPLTLMALLIGLALNFLSADARLTPGLAFASRSLLRWGIVLVGVRITAGQIVALGPVALLCVVAIVALTMGAGVLAARRLGQDTAFGVLAGGGVAICGASAAMALATTLGEKRTSQAQLTLVLVGISAMSASAMMLYPLVAHAFHLSDLKAGFLLGASIHDVAQALGAGYSYSDGAGGIAAIVKLTRVALAGASAGGGGDGPHALRQRKRGRGEGAGGAVVRRRVLRAGGGQFVRRDPASGGDGRGKGSRGNARVGGHRDRDPLALVAIAGGRTKAAIGDPRVDVGSVRDGAGGSFIADRISEPSIRASPARTEPRVVRSPRRQGQAANRPPDTPSLASAGAPW